MTVKITLACTECKQRNYNKEKNKKNSPDRLEMKKYCRFCKSIPFTAKPSEDRSLEMADNKAATAAAQTQSDKPKKERRQEEGLLLRQGQELFSKGSASISKIRRAS